MQPTTTTQHENYDAEDHVIRQAIGGLKCATRRRMERRAAYEHKPSPELAKDLERANEEVQRAVTSFAAALYGIARSANAAEEKAEDYARRDSNPQPTVPKFLTT